MSAVSPHSPRRQRKELYTAHTFQRRLRMSAPLSRELRSRFHQRSLPIRKGDTVRVLSGSFAGREERVAKVNRRDYSVTLDNVTLKTADEKLKPLSLGVGHLVITRLNLSDPWRRRALRAREEDVTPEERGEPVEEETTEAPAAGPTASTPTEPEGVSSDGGEDKDAGAPSEPSEPAAPKPAHKAKAKATEEDDE